MVHACYPAPGDFFLLRDKSKPAIHVSILGTQEMKKPVKFFRGKAVEGNWVHITATVEHKIVEIIAPAGWCISEHFAYDTCIKVNS